MTRRRTGYQTGACRSQGQWPPPPRSQRPASGHSRRPASGHSRRSQWAQPAPGRSRRQVHSHLGRAAARPARTSGASSRSQGQWPPAPPAGQARRHRASGASSPSRAVGTAAAAGPVASATARRTAPGPAGRRSSPSRVSGASSRPPGGQWPPQQPPPNQWAPAVVASQAGPSSTRAAGGSDYPVDVRYTPEARIGRYWGIPLLGFWLRYLLLIPHFIVLFFVGIVAFLATLLTWIPVLLTGRYPGWGYTLVGGYLRWGIRVGDLAVPDVGHLSARSPARPRTASTSGPVRRAAAHRPLLGHPASWASCIRAILLHPALHRAAGCWASWSTSSSCSRGCRCSSTGARRTSSTTSWAATCAGRRACTAYLLLLSGPYPPFRLD